MKALTLIFSVLVLATPGVAQRASEAETKSQVLVDADRMAAAFLAKDFKTFAEYTYTPLFDKAGGRDVFIAKMEQSVKELEGQGTHCDSIWMTDQSVTVKCNGEWQCLVKQTIKLTFPGDKPHYDIGYLIAISVDEGKSWKFLNGAKRPIAVLRNDFPNVCESLPLKPKYLGE